MKYIKLMLSKIFTLLAVLTLAYRPIGLKVNFYSRFTKNTTIGKNCHFNGMIIRGKGVVTIGDNFHSGKEILLLNSYHKYENANALPYDTVEMINKEIVIEDNVWIGDRAIILGGVTIGEGAIIQAGAVVVRDIPRLSIAGGNPATVFKHRDAVLFEVLKAKKKFA